MVYLPPGFWRLIGTYAMLSRGSLIVLAGLPLCLLVAIVWKRPAGSALKHSAPVALWIGLPAALGWLVAYAPPMVGWIALPLWLYADVYAALFVGNRLRLIDVNTRRAATPKPISLRVPAVLASVPVAFVLNAFINTGLGVPAGLMPELAFFILVACVVAIIGFLLTTNHVNTLAAVPRNVWQVLWAAANKTAAWTSPSPTPQASATGNFHSMAGSPVQAAPFREPNATSALQRDQARPGAATDPELSVSPNVDSSDTTTDQRDQPMMSSTQTTAKTTAVAVRETQSEISTVPVPAMPASNSPQGIKLKLKRSQRASLMGKVIFVLDARIELTAEEAGLLRKYRLGDDVVYESANRKQRKEATLAHLEMSASKTSLRDPMGAQMLGVGKTMYRLARAGVSATAAALSLRITINSLMAGVHVECKSIGELVEAETAIIEAARGVRDYLDLAETFDGREEILEF